MNLRGKKIKALKQDDLEEQRLIVKRKVSEILKNMEENGNLEDIWTRNGGISVQLVTKCLSKATVKLFTFREIRSMIADELQKIKKD